MERLLLARLWEAGGGVIEGMRGGGDGDVNIVAQTRRRRIARHGHRSSYPPYAILPMLVRRNGGGGKEDGYHVRCHSSELKKWMTKIRSQLMASQPSDERVKVLNHVNFPWSLRETKWNRHYEVLVEFHAVNGHCNVHQACCLGQWVNNQRRSKMNGKLSAERIELLDGLSFGWSRVRN